GRPGTRRGPDPDTSLSVGVRTSLQVPVEDRRELSARFGLEESQAIKGRRSWREADARAASHHGNMLRRCESERPAGGSTGACPMLWLCWRRRLHFHLGIPSAGAKADLQPALITCKASAAYHGLRRIWAVRIGEGR